MKKKLSMILAVLLLLCLLIYGCGAGDLTYEGQEATAGYTSAENAEVPPEDIAKGPITEIKEGAYKDSSLKSFTIPDGVTVIGKDAFASSTDLVTVIIPANPDMNAPLVLFCKLCNGQTSQSYSQHTNCFVCSNIT